MKKITGVLQIVILTLGIILLFGLIALIYNGLRAISVSSNSYLDEAKYEDYRNVQLAQKSSML